MTTTESKSAARTALTEFDENPTAKNLALALDAAAKTNGYEL